MSGRYAGVKGMNDLLPGEIEVWQHFEHAARKVLHDYGFAEIRTPAVEDTALFVRSVGEETDIVGKEMYTFDDKAGRSLTLRPEGTAPAVRAYVEHAVAQKEPVTRWWYFGPMFRYERMKTGRYRQFYQLGAELFGVREPAGDVEVIELVHHLLARLELPGVAVQVNSLGDDACRPAYQEKLVAHLRENREALCADCKVRVEKNPLRVLDCKNDQCQRIAQQTPSIVDFLCEPCRAHFSEVRRQLDLLGVPHQVNPRMVRGLDYYTRTAFEFVSTDPVLGTASAVGGGGRYDKLVRLLGGGEVPSVGFALGVDRICLLLAASKRSFGASTDLFVVAVDEKTHDQVLKLTAECRHRGFRVEFDPRLGSLKSQMKRADKSGARFCLVLGEQELAEGSAELKPLAGGQPRKVSLSALADALAAKE